MPSTGLNIRTLGTVPDPDGVFPILREDPILPDEGALYLFDFAHGLNDRSAAKIDTSAGVPATGAAVPNLAWEQAATMVGSGTETTLTGQLSYGGITTAGSTKGKIEFTPKGGLHVIQSQSIAFGSDDGAALILASGPHKDWLTTHRNDHQWFFEIWTKTTRLATHTGIVKAEVGGGSTGGTVLLYNMSRISSGGLGNPRLGQRNSTATTTVQRANVAGGVTAITNAYQIIAPWLTATRGGYTFNDANLATYNTKWASEVLYLAYAEDLTVSGRTYAEADAAGAASFALAFGSTGRFYGDTIPTDPTTIA